MESGVYLETIKEGTGTSPGAMDDVEAHYILTTALGDTMESSYTAGQPIKINLTYGMGGGIIKGWTIGFQTLLMVKDHYALKSIFWISVLKVQWLNFSSLRCQQGINS